MANAAGKSLTLSAGSGNGLNQVGGNFTIQGGKSTGNVTGGQIIFQVADGGGSGTNVNTLGNAFVINDDKTSQFYGNVTTTNATVTGSLSVSELP